jgi:DNA-directed RNA polymerase specialized sigma24 family protein
MFRVAGARSLSHLARQMQRGRPMYRSSESARPGTATSRGADGRLMQSVSLRQETWVEKRSDPSSPPGMRQQKRQPAANLHRTLARLPEKYRLIMALRDPRELSVGAVAHPLSLTASLVKTWHHRSVNCCFQPWGVPGAFRSAILIREWRITRMQQSGQVLLYECINCSSSKRAAEH